MLHQPATTFQPSSPTPTTAQPFDTKRYLDRAFDLGIMLFPTITSSGRRLIGHCAYPGYSFSVGNERLSDEFHDERDSSADGLTSVFDALCQDFGLDPADERFNDKVNSICHERSSRRSDGDKRLIELCRRAKIALEKDLAATNLLTELEERFTDAAPERPTYVFADGKPCVETRSASEMRAHLRESRSCNAKSILDEYRARIAKVAAFEKERARISREIGLDRAKRAASQASDRSIAAVCDVSELPATTLLGMSHKAAIFFLWDRAGYGLSDQLGERLAHSIADDARMLGEGAKASRGHGSGRRPSAQVH